jgi:hypothetical protein
VRPISQKPNEFFNDRSPHVAPSSTSACASETSVVDGREIDVQFEVEAGTLPSRTSSAAFQTGQPLSYRPEVERLRESGSAAWSVLIYPERHTARLMTTGGEAFDELVTLEKLI